MRCATATPASTISDEERAAPPAMYLCRFMRSGNRSSARCASLMVSVASWSTFSPPLASRMSSGSQLKTLLRPYRRAGKLAEQVRHLDGRGHRLPTLVAHGPAGPGARLIDGVRRDHAEGHR